MIEVRQRFYRGDLDIVKSRKAESNLPMGYLAAMCHTAVLLNWGLNWALMGGVSPATHCILFDSMVGLCRLELQTSTVSR